MIVSGSPKTPPEPLIPSGPFLNPTIDRFWSILRPGLDPRWNLHSILLIPDGEDTVALQVSVDD